jgi:hypothetical protein
MEYRILKDDHQSLAFTLESLAIAELYKKETRKDLI